MFYVKYTSSKTKHSKTIIGQKHIRPIGKIYLDPLLSKRFHTLEINSLFDSSSTHIPKSGQAYE